MKQSSKNKTDHAARRSFLKRLWGVLGFIAGAEVLWISSGFLRPGGHTTDKPATKLITAGRVADFKPGDVFPFRNGQFYLARYANGGFMAISLKCSHLGCSVIWDETDKVFNCPCHASSFDAYGEVIKPPAPKALDIYPVVIEEGLVKIDVSHTLKRKSFEQAQITFG